MNWRGKPRSNDTHASTTDPDASLYKKSDKTPAALCYQGHVLMVNRSGLVVGVEKQILSSNIKCCIFLI